MGAKLRGFSETTPKYRPFPPPTDYITLTLNYDYKTPGYLEHLLQGHRKWKVQGSLGLKLIMKCCQKNVFSLSFSVEIESSISMKGREFQSRGKRLKYSLLWILFLGLEWRSLKNVADRVVVVMNSWMLKGRSFVFTHLIKNRMSLISYSIIRG